MENKDTNTEVDNEVQIDLLEVFFYVWERIWIVILCALMCGGAAYVSSNYFMTEYYKSSTTVWVMGGNNDTTSSITYNDIQVNTQMANDYIQIITSRTVLEKVIEQQGLTDTVESLSQRISATKKTDTRMIDITVTDTDPLRAQAIANTIYEVASERIIDVIKLDNIAVTRVDEANLPTVPSSPNVKKYTLLGVFAGIFVSVVLIVILFLLDDTIKTDEDVEKYLGFSPLASIPQIEESGKEKGKKNSRNTEKRDSVKAKKKLVPSKSSQSVSEADN